MTVRVAPNSVNTIVVPRTQLQPKPDRVGGVDRLPENNPAVALELPEVPQGRVSLGVAGRTIPEQESAVRDRTVYFAVPPLVSPKANGRISYVADGAMRLLTFELRRTESVDEVMTSLQTQFDNMTALVDDSIEPLAADEGDFMYEQARAVQARIVNAMESMPWSPEEFDSFQTLSSTLNYTRGPS